MCIRDRNKLDFACGDMNTSIIKTTMGRTVLVEWDETSPVSYTHLDVYKRQSLYHATYFESFFAFLSTRTPKTTFFSSLSAYNVSSLSLIHI